MIRLRFHEVFFWQTAPAATLIHVGADSLKKPHDIVTLSFSEVFFQVEGQANYCMIEKVEPLSV